MATHDCGCGASFDTEEELEEHKTEAHGKGD